MPECAKQVCEIMPECAKKMCKDVSREHAQPMKEVPGISTYRQLQANSRDTKTQRHRDTGSLVYDVPLSFLADSLSTPGSVSRYRTVLEWCGPVSPAVPPFLVPPLRVFPNPPFNHSLLSDFGVGGWGVWGGLWVSRRFSARLRPLQFGDFR